MSDSNNKLFLVFGVIVLMGIIIVIAVTQRGALRELYHYKVVPTFSNKPIPTPSISLLPTPTPELKYPRTDLTDDEKYVLSKLQLYGAFTSKEEEIEVGNKVREVAIKTNQVDISGCLPKPPIIWIEPNTDVYFTNK